MDATLSTSIELPPSKTDPSMIVFNVFTKSMRWLKPPEVLWLVETLVKRAKTLEVNLAGSGVGR